MALYSSYLKLNLAQISSHIALLFSVNTPTTSVMLSILLSLHFFLFSAIHTVCNSDAYLSLSPWSQHDTQFTIHFTSAKNRIFCSFVLCCVFQFNTILMAFCLHFILCVYIQKKIKRWFGDISQKQKSFQRWSSILDDYLKFVEMLVYIAVNNVICMYLF